MTTEHYTTNNTNGFTDDQLAALNAVRDQITVDDIEETNISDAIFNTFLPGITVDEHVAAVKERLGL